MTPDQMRALGLYISEPRSAQETDRPFAEPGLFVVNPEGNVQIVEISNAPFARPDLAGILHGIKVIQERNYPVRGTMALPAFSLSCCPELAKPNGTRNTLPIASLRLVEARGERLRKMTVSNSTTPIEM